MFLSLTIATIATMVGSSLIRLASKDRTQKEQIPPADSFEDDYKLKKTPISEREKKAYDSLLDILFSTKDVNKFKEAIYAIESEYYHLEILDRSEKDQTIFNLFKGRIENYCNTEKNNTDLTLLNKLKDYITFLFLKTDKATLENQYRNQTLLLSALSCIKIRPIPINPNKKKYPDELTTAFNIIFDANKKILKEEASSCKYCYYDLLNDCGKVYNEIAYLNESIGYISNANVFNDVMVLEIAETVLANTNFYFCRGLTPSVLAKDLKAHIIHYLHHNQPTLENNEDVEYLTEILDNNYFKHRKIRNYYYFLTLSARFVETLKNNWQKKNILKNVDLNNIEGFYKIAQNLLFDKIRKYEYPYLQGLSEDEIFNHILATKAENNDMLNKFHDPHSSPTPH